VLNENNRVVIALLVGFLMGVVVGFGALYALLSMSFGPYPELCRTSHHAVKRKLDVYARHEVLTAWTITILGAADSSSSPSFTRGTFSRVLAYVYGNVRPRTGWLVNLVRFERHIIGEVIAVSIYVILLNRYLLVLRR
jgi:hypothetical protein